MAEVSRQVAASSDDARQNSSTVGLTATTPAISGTSQKLGFRFTNITVPQGQVIDYAYFYVTVANGLDDDPVVDLSFHDIDDSPTFEATNNNISNRAKTSTVRWDADNVGYSEVLAGTMTSQAQAIFNRAGWVSGNAMSVIMDGVAGCEVDITAYDGDPSKAARLVIGYTDATSQPVRSMHQFRIRRG